MKMSGRRQDLPALTSLRFFAAGVVLLNHTALATQPDLPQFLSNWARSGYDAVTLFFVLSGFILTYVYSNDDGTALNAPVSRFLMARFARIAPAYYFALLILLPAFVYSWFAAGMVSTKDFAFAAVLVPTLLQAWHPPSALGWNAPAWSLSVEFFFYVMFPAVFRCSRRWSPLRFAVAATCLVLVSSVLQERLAGPADSADWHNFIAYFPLFHFAAFVFGVALGRVYLFCPTLSERARRWLFVTSAVTVVVVLALRSELPAWVTGQAVLVPLFGTLIYGATAALSSGLLVLLGEASYALYVLHPGVIFWWRWIAHKVLGVDIPIGLELLIIFSLAVIASVATLVLIERPLRAWTMRRAAPHFGWALRDR